MRVDITAKDVASIEMMSYNKSKKLLTVIGALFYDFDEKTSILFADINGKPLQLKNHGIFTDNRTNSKTSSDNFSFRIDIDLKDVSIPLRLSFYTKTTNSSDTKPLRVSFIGQMSKLTNRLSCWRFDGLAATHDYEQIRIDKKSFKTKFFELGFILHMAIAKRRFRAAALRLLYWLTKPVMGRRNIWLYADKIYRSGDNAEWLYRYSIKQKDGINHHYVLDAGSKDVAKFEELGFPYIKYKSLRQRLLFLHCKILVFTHSNAPAYYRFGGVYEAFFRDLFDYDVMYVQHGLIVQDIAWLYNRTRDDIKRFFIASKFERDNLLQKEYGYMPEDIVESGVPRYDGLKNKAKKRILIAPTWRSNMAPPLKDIGSKRDSDEAFKKTEYYKTYMSLITDERLAAQAKQLGYEISLVLHPDFGSQLEDFKLAKNITVHAAGDGFEYHQALSEASIMVTDYSGIQFDFAYMRKPVVYFQPSQLPPNYRQSAYRYDKHALGEITDDVGELVDLLCEYMKNDCQLKQKYQKRIDKFFYHGDNKNAKRIYDSIIEWQNS